MIFFNHNNIFFNLLIIILKMLKKIILIITLNTSDLPDPSNLGLTGASDLNYLGQLPRHT